MWAGEQNEEERSIAKAGEAAGMRSPRMDAGLEDFVDRYDNEESVDVRPGRVTRGSRDEERTDARALKGPARLHLQSSYLGPAFKLMGVLKGSAIAICLSTLEERRRACRKRRWRTPTTSCAGLMRVRAVGKRECERSRVEGGPFPPSSRSTGAARWQVLFGGRAR